jgi:putative transposase
MARRQRNQQPGYHHAVSRGNNKQRIFLDDRDRLTFLALLDRVASRHDWHILAHCLMRNHYHLVLRIAEPNLARGMWELNLVYARYFNGEHGRLDHLFGKRYWSEQTATEEHMLNAVRYVVQNPRRAGAKGPLETHSWTSYRAAIGHEFGSSRFARDELLALFGRDPRVAVPEFMAFCEQPTPPRQQGDPRNQVTARKLHLAVT